MRARGIGALAVAVLLAAALTQAACGGDAPQASPGPQCNPACGAGETCVIVPGTSLTTCQGIPSGVCDPACPTGQVCDNGQCVPDTPTGCDPACPTGETCVGSQCVPDTPTGCDPACVAGFECKNSQCVPIAAGTKSCAEIATCYGTCADGDNACMQACYDQGSADGKAGDDALWGCIQAKSCQDSACAQAQCAAEWTACFGPPTGCVPACTAGFECKDGQCVAIPAGTKTCDEINVCYSGCADGDNACIQGCYGQGSAAGKAADDALWGCIQAKGCQDNACAQDQCAAEWTACFGPPTGCVPACTAGLECKDGQCVALPTGTKTCDEINVCYGTCADGDNACMQACYGQGSAAGKAADDTLWGCIDAKGCQDNACAQAQCAAEWTACFGPPTGCVPACTAGLECKDGQCVPVATEWTCAEINACYVDCGEDTTCYQACYAQGSAEAKAFDDALWGCIANQGCQDEACVASWCSAESDACFGGAGCGAVTDVGECAGDVLSYCYEAELLVVDCAAYGCECGAVPGAGYYDCIGCVGGG